MLTKRYLLLGVVAHWTVNAHIIMTSPERYSKGSLNNSPLAANGSDFPCKLRPNAFKAPSRETTIAVGETHTLAFQGSATHGGGSCQVRLTGDRQPSKDSEWKVIKSFQGGCLADVAGNLAGGATSSIPITLDFMIPKGIDLGQYTLAWTWFNRLGKREMYMNCAAITVSSGLKKRSTEAVQSSSAFPPMFIANINDCSTTEGVDLRFPRPGVNIEYMGQPANLAQENEAACTGTPTFGSSAVANILSSGSSNVENSTCTDTV
jgi:hypothetical protein